MNIREEVANQMAEDDFVSKAQKYIDLIKQDKPFNYPFHDSGLVRALQELHATTWDEAYATGYNDGQLVKQAKENRKNVTKHSMP